jgi:hypothetical protein
MTKVTLKVVKTAKFSVLGLPSETDVEVAPEKNAKKARK